MSGLEDDRLHVRDRRNPHELVAVGHRRDRRREAEPDRTALLDQRHHGLAQRGQRRTEDQRHLARGQLREQLDRDLGIGLVVLDRELDRASLDPAAGVHHGLERAQRVGFLRSEERRAAGQRKDDVDLVRRVGSGRRRGRRRPQRDHQGEQSDESSHGHAWFAAARKSPASNARRAFADAETNYGPNVVMPKFGVARCGT